MPGHFLHFAMFRKGGGRRGHFLYETTRPYQYRVWNSQRPMLAALDFPLDGYVCTGSYYGTIDELTKLATDRDRCAIVGRVYKSYDGALDMHVTTMASGETIFYKLAFAPQSIVEGDASAYPQPVDWCRAIAKEYVQEVFYEEETETEDGLQKYNSDYGMSDSGESFLYVETASGYEA